MIEAPTEWVAFTADLTKNLPGKESILGRYFRASNGSDRLETGPTGDPARVVFIKNVPQSTYYSRRIGANGVPYWIGGPMKLPPDGWKPTQMTEEIGRRVMLREKVEGFAVVQIASTGSVSLFAPDLNYHPLVRRHIADGYQELYRNVRLGEPSADLFLPPAGDEVRRTERVGGIAFSMAVRPHRRNEQRAHRRAASRSLCALPLFSLTHPPIPRCITTRFSLGERSAVHAAAQGPGLKV